MKHSSLEKLTKAELIDIIVGKACHEFTVQFTIDPEDPRIINWYWDGGMSGCDDVEDYVKRIFPEMLQEELDFAETLDHEDGIAF